MLLNSETPFTDKTIHEQISEKDKMADEYLIGNINYTISHLMVDKTDLKIAANYYHGQMDKEQFKYLEDQFGIGNACDLEFIPLVRSHIEVLKGQLLTNPLKFGITCRDEKTLRSIQEDKKRSLNKELLERVVQQVKLTEEWVKSYYQGDKFKEKPITITDEWVSKVVDEFNTNWVSAFEEAAQVVLNATLTDVNVDFRAKMVQMFENLLVYGSCYYRVKVENEGDAPTIEVINPINLYYSKNTNDTYVKYSTRVAYRFYKTPEELINMFPEMTDEEVEYITSMKGYGSYGSDYQQDLHVQEMLHGIPSNYNDGTYNFKRSNAIECFHVEWLANNEVEVEDYTDMVKNSRGELVPKKLKRYRLDRYSGYKIGGRLFLRMGKDKVMRSQSAPYKCTISYNGASYTDVNGKPYSLVLKTKSLQDKYNIYYFLRDNVVANAGVKGQYVELSMLPNFLGSSPEERYLAAIAMSKQGHMPLNSSQEGSSQMNTIFQGFDNSLDFNSIQAYDMLLARIEENVSQITGIPKPMLGDIEQRDAVRNVQVSMRQALIINKPLFSIMDSLMRQCLTDLIDLSKATYSDSRYGALLLGDYRNKIFTIDPKYFRFSDHDIHIVDFHDILEDKEKIQSLTMELVKGGLVQPDVAFDVMTASSLTEAKVKAERGIKVNDMYKQQMEQASQRMQQLEQQLQEISKVAEKYNQEQAQLNSAKIQEINSEIQLKQQELEIEKERLKTETKVAEQQLKIEALQLYNSNGNDDEPKNIKL